MFTIHSFWIIAFLKQKLQNTFKTWINHHIYNLQIFKYIPFKLRNQSFIFMNSKIVSYKTYCVSGLTSCKKT